MQEYTIESQLLDRHSILSQIGNTPLIRVRNIGLHPEGVEMYAKAEWLNPGGSVKDRPALNMLMEAERSGELTREKIIIDATSGNTGIAYALIATTMGYRLMLALPENASEERKRILRTYDVDLIFTSPLEGTDGAQRVVKELVAAHPEKYYYPDQYNNPANWQSHYKTTAREIWSQTGGRVTHFVAGLGTTGTFIGTTRRLKELNPFVLCISFEPDSPLHGLEGLKHMETAIVPGIYDATLADDHLRVSTEEAYDMVRRLAREEGLFVGISSGAAMATALRVASELHSGVVVTIFPDGGEKYLSDTVWERE
ncbi:MAG: cysteine synthase family protein [Ignavibacteriae bacterium]|nr:cysteine synthase family protein [Ignavibacteria bacterium]MBI3363577.1 cysteine synthase family protein [Ignavibacteriota bacterium]